jgi:hypothetical protein
MPKGPRGEKRPKDVASNAVKVARLAVGDEEEELKGDGKDPAPKALGAKGGAARAKSLSAKKRSKAQQDFAAALRAESTIASTYSSYGIPAE